MRRIVQAAIGCAAIGAACLVPASAATAKAGALSGTWTSIDNDGSSQTLDITGSGQGSYAMFLTDDSATSACGGALAKLVGSGTSDGDLLQMSGALVCLPGGNVLRGRVGILFVYAPATDTLTDETGVTWHRS